MESIRKNSAFRHEIILHINDGSDGTLAWAKNEQIPFTSSPGNIGICIAVNMAAGKATKDYIAYMNDDMYVCPGWDTALAREIESCGTENFMFSGTLIEPNGTNNPCVVVKDFGTGMETFREAELLSSFDKLDKEDWSGSSWPPNVVHRHLWDIVGGYSIEFSPGMSSDDDFTRKMWAAGVRLFKGVGTSKTYHFLSKSTGRVKKNDGRKQFLNKWGINQSTFNKHYLKRGEPFHGLLTGPDAAVLKKEKLRARIKQIMQNLGP